MEVTSINASTREVVIKTAEEHYDLYELELQRIIETEELEKIVSQAFKNGTTIDSVEQILRDNGIVMKLRRSD